jgi:hypothetical protein
MKGYPARYRASANDGDGSPMWSAYWSTIHTRSPKKKQSCPAIRSHQAAGRAGQWMSTPAAIAAHETAAMANESQA